MGDFSSLAGVTINFDNALSVPAIWAAVIFIGGTLTSLPLEVFRSLDTGHKRIHHSVRAWLIRVVNPALDSFA